MKHVAGLVLVVLVSLLMFACRPGQSSREFRGQLESRIAEGLQQGKTNDVIRFLEKAMDRQDCRDIRPALFAHALSLRANTERLESVRARYMQLAAKDPAMAEAGFRGIEGSLQASGRIADLASWSRSLLHAPLPVGVRVSAYRYALEESRKGGNAGDLAALLAQAISSLPANYGLRLVESVSSDSLHAKQEALVDQIAGLLESVPPADSAYAALGNAVRVRRALAFSGYAAAGSEYRDRLGRLGDNANRVFGEVVTAAKEDRAFVESLSGFVLKQTQPSDILFRTAARQLMDVARTSGKAEPVISALRQLRELHMAPAHLGLEIERVLYDIMPVAGKDEQKALLDLAWPLFDEVKTEADKHDIGMLLLDGCALGEDYERALALLAKGIPQQDPRSNRMTEYKIRAHLAMAGNDYRGAVTNLQAFIGQLDLKEAFPNPLTGGTVPASYVVGLNLARIGELLGKAGEPALSADNYRQAKASYELALKDPRCDAKLRLQIEKEVAALPVGAAGATP